MGPMQYTDQNVLPFDRFACNQMHGAQNGFVADIQAPAVSNGRRTIAEELPTTDVRSTGRLPVTNFPSEHEIKNSSDDVPKINRRPVRDWKWSQTTIDYRTEKGKSDFERVMRRYVTSKGYFQRLTRKVTESDFVTDEGIDVLELSLSIQEGFRKDPSYRQRPTRKVTSSVFVTDEGIDVLELSISIQEEFRKRTKPYLPITPRRVPYEQWSVSNILSTRNLERCQNSGEQEANAPRGQQVYRGVQLRRSTKNTQYLYTVLVFPLPSNPDYCYMFEVRLVCTLYTIYRCIGCKNLKCSKDVNIQVTGDQFHFNPSSLPHSCQPLITKHITRRRQKVEEKTFRNDIACGREPSTEYRQPKSSHLQHNHVDPVLGALGHFNLEMLMDQQPSEAIQPNRIF